MTVGELIQKLALNDWTPELDKGGEVTGGYVGDLLSWVMGRAQPDAAWITIMSNVNVVAVASLADVACVLLAEGVVPDDDMLNRAKQQDVIVLGSEQPSFALAAAIERLLQDN